MPVHDWSRVFTSTFHDFHGRWITHLTESLNDGLLPEPYYALSEQIATRMQPDVLTLRDSLKSQPTDSGREREGVAVVESPPRVQFSMHPNSKTRPKRPILRHRRIVIRHISGHQVIAVIEIVSPANKDRKSHVRDLSLKVVGLLEADIQVLLIDLWRPAKHDPHGMHGAVWSYFDATPFQAPGGEPLALASYVWEGTEPRAYVQPLDFGQALPEMPLFLNRERYINVPLEATYEATYRVVPAVWRRALEASTESPPQS
jgi:hypothetical protein